MTELLDLLAMWGLLQVLFVCCFARAAGLRELRSQQYTPALTAHESREIQLFDSLRVTRTDGPCNTSNPN